MTHFNASSEGFSFKQKDSIQVCATHNNRLEGAA